MFSDIKLRIFKFVSFVNVVVKELIKKVLERVWFGSEVLLNLLNGFRSLFFMILSFVMELFL